MKRPRSIVNVAIIIALIIFFGVVSLIANVAGNWTSGFVDPQTFTVREMVITIAIGLLASISVLFIGILMQRAVDSHYNFQGQETLNEGNTKSTIEPAKQEEEVHQLSIDSDHFLELSAIVDQTKLDDLAWYIERGYLPRKFNKMVEDCYHFANQTENEHVVSDLKRPFDKFFETLKQLRPELDHFLPSETDPTMLDFEPEKRQSLDINVQHEWASDRQRVHQLARHLVEDYRVYRRAITIEFPFDLGGSSRSSRSSFSTRNMLNKIKIRNVLNERFSLDELKSLSYDMGINYENFPHALKDEFCRSLVDYCERHDVLHQLVEQITIHRPKFKLSDFN